MRHLVRIRPIGIRHPDLDRLAAASLPIKRLTLTAAAHVVGADGEVLVEEAELLRAISAALDCPMPPAGGEPAPT